MRCYSINLGADSEAHEHHQQQRLYRLRFFLNLFTADKKENLHHIGDRLTKDRRHGCKTFRLSVYRRCCDNMTLLMKLTMAEAGCSGSSSANMWQTFSAKLPGFLATKPNTLRAGKRIWYKLLSLAFSQRQVESVSRLYCGLVLCNMLSCRTGFYYRIIFDAISYPDAMQRL